MLRSRRGVSRLAFLLAIGILLMLAIFAVEGYIKHLNDAKMTFDKDQVSAALEVAKMTYMLDGTPDGVTYYFDAEHWRMVGYDKIRDIVPYGRSDARHNRNGETGALGIPNLPGRGGEQLLAIAFEGPDEINIRWQGKTLTPYDLTLMTGKEQARLTAAQRDEIARNGGEQP